MEKLSVGQKKFLAEFLGNFSIAWVVDAVVSPFFTGTLLIATFWSKIIIGTINAGWAFTLAFFITKEVLS